jgi:hypothetical protein
MAALLVLCSLQAAADPAQLRRIAHDYYSWRDTALLGRYRDSEGTNFGLSAFHDRLISYGTLPLSVVERLMFDDESSVRQAMK